MASMEKWRNCLTAALAWALIVLAATVSGADLSYSDLVNLTASTEDTRMDALDLAFFLVTHDFDASPDDEYVMVIINGTAYTLTPNGERPGLADIEIAD